MKNLSLWKRIAEYNFPTEMHERMLKMWGNPNVASEILEEYRRFLYLAVVTKDATGHQKLFDDVWWLHRQLLGCKERPLKKFFLDYFWEPSKEHDLFEVGGETPWQRFCLEVLGQQFPISPVKKSVHRSVHLKEYEATLKAYREEFQNEPPIKVWPTIKSARFFYKTMRWYFLSFPLTLILFFVAVMVIAATGVHVWFAAVSALPTLVIFLVMMLHGFSKGQYARADQRAE